MGILDFCKSAAPPLGPMHIVRLPTLFGGPPAIIKVMSPRRKRNHTNLKKAPLREGP